MSLSIIPVAATAPVSASKAPVAAQPAAAAPKSAPAQTPAPASTVKISPAAQALQEAVETSVQTAQEARGGDSQAIRLLAREAAQKKA